MGVFRPDEVAVRSEGTVFAREVREPVGMVPDGARLFTFLAQRSSFLLLTKGLIFVGQNNVSPGVLHVGLKQKVQFVQVCYFESEFSTAAGG